VLSDLEITEVKLKYIGKKRTPDYDCHSLMRDILQSRGCYVPSPDILEQSVSRFFVEVDEPEPGDVVQFELADRRLHLGVFLGRGEVINCMKDHVCVIRLRNASSRVKGFFRHRGMLD